MREKRENKMYRVNYYQSASNSQKDKLNILAEMLEISKSGLRTYVHIYYNRPLTLYELLSELTISNRNVKAVSMLGRDFHHS